MNSLNYIGSKRTLLPEISKVLRPLISTSLADLFAGTGAVGFKFINDTNIISNDMEKYSYVINKALLCYSYDSIKMVPIFEELNKLEGVEGLMYSNFSPNENCERMFFTKNNAKKCDAIRQKIEEDYKNTDDYYFLLASLITSLDKVANTSCVYGAYLKKFKKSSQKSLVLEPIHKNKFQKSLSNEVFNKPVEELLSKEYDVVYLDPPYNQRQYSSNYSPLNYLVEYSDKIKLTGKTGLISGYNRSKFCSSRYVAESFQNLIDNLKCNYIVLSYNNEGLLKEEDLKKILEKKGDTTLHRLEYRKFKSNSNVKNNLVYEYLWVVKVINSTGSYQ